MTEQPASQGATTTLPPPSANGTSPQLPAALSPLKFGRTRTRISALLMAAAGTARITQLRRIMRRDRRKPPAS
jgi:hypothetical protein